LVLGRCVKVDDSPTIDLKERRPVLADKRTGADVIRPDVFLDQVEHWRKVEYGGGSDCCCLYRGGIGCHVVVKEGKGTKKERHVPL
jgi:hypothetical protein